MSKEHLNAGYVNYKVWLRRANSATGKAEVPVSKQVFGTMLKRCGKEGSTLSGPLALVFRKSFFYDDDVAKSRLLSVAAGITLAKFLRGNEGNIASELAANIKKLSHNKFDVELTHLMVRAMDAIMAMLKARSEEKANDLKTNVVDQVLNKIK